jgi:hypothetical protein
MVWHHPTNLLQKSFSPLTGLTNGTAHTFTVTATNAVGTGPASSASNRLTPINVPEAPTVVKATAGNAQAKITFKLPASNGGSAITPYSVTSSPGGFTAKAKKNPTTVIGLANGTACSKGDSASWLTDGRILQLQRGFGQHCHFEQSEKSEGQRAESPEPCF